MDFGRPRLRLPATANGCGRYRHGLPSNSAACSTTVSLGNVPLVAPVHVAAREGAGRWLPLVTGGRCSLRGWADLG